MSVPLRHALIETQPLYRHSWRRKLCCLMRMIMGME